MTRPQVREPVVTGDTRDWQSRPKRLRHVVAAAGLALAAIAGFAAPASADKQRCWVDVITLEVKCVLVVGHAPAKDVSMGDGLPLVWRRLPWFVGEDVANGHGCVRIDGNTTIIGALYILLLVNTATNEVFVIDPGYCVMPGDPLPAPPPGAPTLPEFKESAAAVLTLNPTLSPPAQFGGITGLDTWLWCASPPTVDVDLALRGWTAFATVQPVGFEWAVAGVGGASSNSSTCGSEGSPAATWRPETEGDHSIALASTWAGTWTLSWGGFDLGVFPLGPATFASAPVAYPVGEFRGVLE